MVAGFISERWPASNRNPGRLHVAIPGRIKSESALEGPERYNKVMTLDTHEFIRRFLMHVLPQGFHRIRHYGLLNNAARARNIARARELLAVPLIPIDAIKAANTKPEQPKTPQHPCPCCGGLMIIIETFKRGQHPTYRPPPRPAFSIDSS